MCEYDKAINDCIEVLCEIYERSHNDPIIYNSGIKKSLEELKKNHTESLPMWKHIRCDLHGNSIIPQNTIVRDGYYLDIISLDRLPKED